VQQSAPIHNAHVQHAITYDPPSVSGTTLQVEIGFDRDVKRGAPIAYLLEYGTAQNPPQRNMGRAFDKEAPEFEKFLGQAIERLL
jgi:hypothetical protein